MFYSITAKLLTIKLKLITAFKVLYHDKSITVFTIEEKVSKSVSFKYNSENKADKIVKNELSSIEIINNSTIPEDNVPNLLSSIARTLHDLNALKKSQQYQGASNQYTSIEERLVNEANEIISGTYKKNRK